MNILKWLVKSYECSGELCNFVFYKTSFFFLSLIIITFCIFFIISAINKMIQYLKLNERLIWSI